MKRNVPLMTEVGFGIASLILPLTISGVFNAYGFRFALDLLGVLFGLVFIGFMIHLISKTRNKPR